MAGAERVVLAFGPLQESRKAVLVAQCFHARIAAGEELVRISLVSDVPDQLVAWCVEHGVQCNGELHDTQASADVATRPGTHVNQSFPHLLRERTEIVA